MSDASIPDYTGHEEQPSEDRLTQLRRMALQMLELDDEIAKLDLQKSELEEKRKRLAHDLIPKTMKDIGIDKIGVTGGVEIVVVDEVRCGKLPTDGRWKSYLEESGDDGLIKREFSISYGRDSTVWAEAFVKHLEDLDVAAHASVEQSETIHSQSLAAFLRRERKKNPEVTEIFGAFVQPIAKIKSR